MPTQTLPDIKTVLKDSFKTGEEATPFKAAENHNDVSGATDPAHDAAAEEAAAAAALEQEQAEAAKKERKEPEKLKGFSEASDEEEPKKDAAQDIDDFARRDGEKDNAFIKRIKSELASAKNTAKQLQDQLAKAPKEDPSELRKQLEEREALIERHRYEDSTAYQTAFGKPIAKETEATKNLVSKFTETKGVFERAMALDGKERMDFLKEHAEDGAQVIFDRMERLNELSHDRDEALKDRAKIAAELKTQEENSQGAQIIAAFNAKREEMTKRFSALRSEHAETFLKQSEGLLAGTAPAEEVIAAAYLAPMVPFYLNKIKTMADEITALKARVGEINEDNPKIHGRGGDAGKGGGSESIIETDGKLKPMAQMLKAGFKTLPRR